MECIELLFAKKGQAKLQIFRHKIDLDNIYICTCLMLETSLW